MNELLKPYRDRIRELRKNIELVGEIHRVAVQTPGDRFVGSNSSNSLFFNVGSCRFGSEETVQIGVLVSNNGRNNNSHYNCRLQMTGSGILLINQRYDEEPRIVTSRVFGLVKKGSDYIGFLSENFGEVTPGFCPKGLEKIFESDLDHVCFWNRYNKQKDEELKHFAIDLNTTRPRQEHKKEWRHYQREIEDNLKEFVINTS